jgi:hypothetical protein
MVAVVVEVLEDIVVVGEVVVLEIAGLVLRVVVVRVEEEEDSGMAVFKIMAAEE